MRAGVKPEFLERCVSSPVRRLSPLLIGDEPVHAGDHAASEPNHEYDQAQACGGDLVAGGTLADRTGRPEVLRPAPVELPREELDQSTVGVPGADALAHAAATQERAEVRRRPASSPGERAHQPRGARALVPNLLWIARNRNLLRIHIGHAHTDT